MSETNEEGWDTKRAGGYMAEHRERCRRRMKEEADAAQETTCGTGDLVIANCWPYPDDWSVCYVTRVDFRGVPVRMVDGSGTVYDDHLEGATIMPKYMWKIPRASLRTPAREIAEASAHGNYNGTIDACAARILEGHLKEDHDR